MSDPLRGSLDYTCSVTTVIAPPSIEKGSTIFIGRGQDKAHRILALGLRGRTVFYIYFPETDRNQHIVVRNLNFSSLAIFPRKRPAKYSTIRFGPLVDLSYLYSCHILDQE